MGTPRLCHIMSFFSVVFAVIVMREELLLSFVDVYDLVYFFRSYILEVVRVRSTWYFCLFVCTLDRKMLNLTLYSDLVGSTRCPTPALAEAKMDRAVCWAAVGCCVRAEVTCKCSMLQE